MPRTPTSRTQNMFEALEPRTVLSLAGTAPAPSLDQLEDLGNPVIRWVTNFGDIDLELFPDTAPNTVNNILRLTRAGNYDQSFFHRFVEDFVIQGGGFTFNNTDGFGNLPNFGTVNNEFARSNLERTLAIAKLGGDPNSGTSQFFINLRDNSGPPAELDTQNGGFTVFGRVLDDRSWGVVQSIISSVETTDFTSVSPPVTNALDETPVRAGTTGQPASEDTLVYIIDAEIIKPLGGDSLFEHRLVYPEGFRGPASQTTVALTNPNNVEADYQVVLRYGSGKRDQAVAFGTLAPHETKFLNYQAGLAFAHPGIAYGIEVWSTPRGGAFNPQPVSANLSHQSDGNAPGSVAGEAFFDPSNIPEAGLRNWLFGGLPEFDNYLGNGSTAQRNAFLLWQNLEPVDGSVLVRVLFADRDPIERTIALPALRRGGLTLSTIPEIGTGAVGFQVLSTVNIASALTAYDAIRGAGEVNPILGSSATTTIGVPNLASTRGALPALTIPEAPARVVLTIANREEATATVTLQFLTGSATVTRTVTVDARRTREVELTAADLGIPAGQSFTLVYEADRRVAVHAYAGSARDNGTVGVGAAAASIYATNAALFAAPPLPGEMLTVFNPSADPAVTVSFQVQLHFYDGSFSGATLVNLGALGRSDIDVSALAAAVGRAGEGFSYTVVSEARSGSTRVPSTIVAQRTRLDNGFQDVLSTATTPGFRFNLDGSIFTGPFA